MAIVTGWGRGTWGQASWGSDIPVVLVGDESLRAVTTLASVTVKGDATVSLTGQQLTTTLNSVNAFTNVSVSLSSQQLTTTLNSVSIDTKTVANITGQLITHQLGELDAGPDATVSGEQVPVYLGDVTVFGNSNLSLTGQSLSLSLNPVTIKLNTPVNVTGQQLTTTLNSVNASISINAPVTGLQLLEIDLLPYLYTTLHDSMTTYDTSAFVNDLTVYEQIPDSGLVRFQDEYAFYTSKSIYTFDADTFILEGLIRGVNGTTPSTHPVGATVKLHDAVTVTADANTFPSGQQLTLIEGVVDPNPDANLVGQQLTTTLDSVEIEIITVAPVTGEQLTLNLGTVSVALGVVVDLTGNSLTTNTGQLYVTAWAAVDTGLSSTWTPVNTAA